MFHRLPNRPGVSLVEMLVAVAVMGILALSISTLATAVYTSNEYSQSHGEAVQHARVACGRIGQACAQAYATPDYPGFWVVSTTIGAYTYPDALVVWQPPGGAPANADGPPLMSELVFITFDPDNPDTLLEITAPSDNRAAPAITNTSSWLSEIAARHNSSAAKKVRLSDLLRVGNSSSDSSGWRGVVRFQTRYHPTAAEWASYQSGATNWEALTWPQNLYGADSGLRQSWCRIELQLVPRGITRRGNEGAANAIAFFGSGSLWYTVEK